MSKTRHRYVYRVEGDPWREFEFIDAVKPGKPALDAAIRQAEKREGIKLTFVRYERLTA